MCKIKKLFRVNSFPVKKIEKNEYINCYYSCEFNKNLFVSFYHKRKIGIMFYQQLN